MSINLSVDLCRFVCRFLRRVVCRFVYRFIFRIELTGVVFDQDNFTVINFCKKNFVSGSVSKICSKCKQQN